MKIFGGKNEEKHKKGTENKKKRLEYWTAIPLCSACFYHVAFSVYMPLIGVIYLLRYVQCGKKRLLYALSTVLLSYALGISMMLDTAHHYVLHNFGNIFFKSGYKFRNPVKLQRGTEKAWEDFERLCEFIAGRDDVFYGTNDGVFKYFGLKK